MSQSRLVLDASALIALARLDLLTDARRLLGVLHVAPEVAAETTESDRPGAIAIREAIGRADVLVLPPAEVRPIPGLGSGETATIRRAAALGMTAVIDDLDARRAAFRLGVALTGTIAILVRLDELGSALTLPDALDRLDHIGFRVAPALRVWALAARGSRTSG